MKLFYFLLLIPLISFSQLKEKHLEKEMTKTVESDFVIHYPEGYQKSKTNFPLIVFLHGSGERGDDLSLLSKHGPLKYVQEGNKLDAVILAPQCPKTEVWDTDVLYALIEDVVKKNKIDFSRIYLTGLSMGGYGTWKLALEHPEVFAAVSPICGLTMYNFVEKAYILKNKPIWVFHGAKDMVVPLSSSENMVNAIIKAGGNPKFTIDPDAGHDSWTKPYSDPKFYEWLLSHEQNFN